MYHYVYLTTNIVNNMKYIGQHSTDNLDDGYVGSGKILKDAIKKYGKENFEKTILEFVETKEILDATEIRYIKEFDAVNSEEFYNITEGGGGTVGVKLTEEQRKKISKRIKELYAKGKLTSPTKGKFGSENPTFGRHLSEKEKENLSKKAKERFENDPNIRTKMYTAERSRKISETRKKNYKEGKYTIQDISGEKNPMYGKKKELHPRYGTHLSEEKRKELSEKTKERYKNGGTPPMQGKKWDEEAKQKMSSSHKGKISGSNNPNFGKGKQLGKPVVCIERNITYSSIAQAAKDNNCWPHQITKCLSGERETAGNSHWKYASQANTVPSSNKEKV